MTCFEGCYARSALLSDTPLYEDDPTSYIVDMRRRHRWIRGDWQIASWLFRRVPGVAGRRERNPLSILSQWKILDNLRRSLVPPALVLLLALGWTVLSPAAYWTLAVLGIMAIPRFARRCWNCCRSRPSRSGASTCGHPWLPAGCDCCRRCSHSPAFPSRPTSISTLSYARRFARSCPAGDCCNGLPLAIRAKQPPGPRGYVSGDVDRSGACVGDRRRDREIQSGRAVGGGANPRRCGSPRPCSRGGRAHRLPGRKCAWSGSRWPSCGCLR